MQKSSRTTEISTNVVGATFCTDDDDDDDDDGDDDNDGGGDGGTIATQGSHTHLSGLATRLSQTFYRSIAPSVHKRC